MGNLTYLKGSVKAGVVVGALVEASPYIAKAIAYGMNIYNPGSGEGLNELADAAIRNSCAVHATAH